MNVMFRGKHYTVSKLASGYGWRFVSVNNRRDGFTMNHSQMVNAGFADIIRGKV